MLQQAPENPPHSSNSDPEISRLVQLLKAEDLDLAADARVDKYTRLVEKWKGCSREEWLAGADGAFPNSSCM